MSASADTLHVLAHRAGARHRDAENWWGSAVETALAAVSASRHPPAHREQAEHALEAIDRWRRSGQVRPVSADAVALALAARTAATLARANRDLLQAAADAVDAMAARGPSVVPELHLALAAWALDDLIEDRDHAPWPGLRSRLERGSVYGVDSALRSYTAAIAARHFDARMLVQELIARVPASPSVTDGSVVLWLLDAAVDRITLALPSDEPGLRALVDRRAALTERLATELNDDTFRMPHVEEFDPQADVASDPGPAYLSPMEALLLDIALAPADPEHAWLSFPQARALFAAQATEERRRTAHERRARAGALAAASVLAGAVVALALLLGGTVTAVAVGWSLTAAFAGLAHALAMLRSVTRQPRVVAAAGVAAVTLSFCTAFNAVNQMLTTPLLSDPAGLIGGAVLAVAAPLVWAVLADRDPDDGRQAAGRKRSDHGAQDRDSR